MKCIQHEKRSENDKLNETSKYKQIKGWTAGFIHCLKHHPKIYPKMVEKGAKMEPNGSKMNQNQSQNRILTLDGSQGAWATATVAKKEDFGAFWGTIFGAFPKHTPSGNFQKRQRDPKKSVVGPEKNGSGKQTKFASKFDPKMDARSGESNAAAGYLL